MANLPTVGGDNGNWGTILNQFLQVGHNGDGTLKGVYSVYNVKDYGAIGDGQTDDTNAIGDAISAIPSTGGVLYFPPGTYVTSGGFTLANPTTVQGCGMIGENGTVGSTSKITCNSSTTTLFTVSAYTARFRDIALVNSAAQAPTAGAGISCALSGNKWDQKVDFDSISVTGFYINIDIQTGEYWSMNNCMLFFPVKYALKIANTANADSGDWSITSSYFIADLYNADAAIRIESSGGGKITNCKINNRSSQVFANGIDLVPTTGVNTIILHIVNCSIENVSANGFNAVINGSHWRSIIIMASEFGLWGNTTGHAIQMTADNAANVGGVSIGGNRFMGNSNASAIDLSTINNVQIFGNTMQAFSSFLTQANCTSVVSQ